MSPLPPWPTSYSTLLTFLYVFCILFTYQPSLTLVLLSFCLSLSFTYSNSSLIFFFLHFSFFPPHPVPSFLPFPISFLLSSSTPSILRFSFLCCPPFFPHIPFTPLPQYYCCRSSLFGFYPSMYSFCYYFFPCYLFSFLSFSLPFFLVFSFLFSPISFLPFPFLFPPPTAGQLA